MLTLHVTQNPKEGDEYPITLTLQEPGFPSQTASARVRYVLDPQDQEDLRWYLEDYLQYPFGPEHQMARRVEDRIAALGRDLFQQLFEAGLGTQRLWDKLADRLNETRVEISAGVQEAVTIPWELLRDPLTDTVLALHARAFVRTQSETARRLPSPQRAEGEAVRVLLVICRPGGRDDVPFRSVARRLLEGLSQEARAHFELEVLRPPTFERLGQALRQAHAGGRPYHVLHFDGHGTYVDVGNWGGFVPNPLLFADARPGKHGYLVFENPALEDNTELVPGPELGKLLAESGVPVLVLNACRSAHAEPSPSPVLTGEGSGEGAEEGADVHAQVRALGSLAQEVVDAGVAGVVAMRYNVYVDTAAQFVADLYGALARGRPLGQAVTYGRKQLATQPLRHVLGRSHRLLDWPVPVVYEAAPLALFSLLADDAPLQVTLTERAGAAPREGLVDVPPPPDVGFFGRDETLLALERTFDAQPVALLHGYAGSGKTATAAEFARWYASTGGLDGGVVLFTSFESHLPLPRVLDKFGAVFEPLLAHNRIHWLALNDGQRRQMALQVLAQVPLLWIWDNVEPVSGFPAGATSQWSADEQRELADFLRDARGTQARFLLTSRRDERPWLGDLPRRVALPPMPLAERVAMARALAGRHGRVLDDLEPWRPLLDFTRGNPLTLTVVVGQALRDGLATEEQIETYVARLRAGQVDFEADETQQGRDKSLGASLSYGFEHAFSAAERPVLALLHLFQGFVAVHTLRLMGQPEADWCLDTVRGLTREAGVALLDRAAEVGLLTAHGGGYYTIHPALPWFFKRLFDEHYPTADDGPPTTEDTQHESRNTLALRAFVEAMGELGNHYFWEYEGGNRDVIGALRAEEANLLHARALARRGGWWLALMKAMQGLRVLYDHTSRRVAWRRLVEEIVPDFVDPADDSPLPGREEQWGLVTGYRVRLARGARDWAAAERLQRVCVEWDRRRAAPALARPPEDALDGAARNAVRTLAASLHDLGQIQREQGKPECVERYQDSIPLYQRIGDRAAEAVAAFNLGHAYAELPALRDLDQAERWYKRALELEDPRDNKGRATDLGQLGYVAWERFKDARKANQPANQLTHHLAQAADHYHQALALLPPDAVDDLAVTHNQLGGIYFDSGDLGRALHHARECIRYQEAAGDLYRVGITRRNIAIALMRQGRLDEALIYARAALANFQPYGAGAADAIQRTQGLIAQIEEVKRKT